MIHFPRNKAEWRTLTFGKGSSWKKRAPIYAKAGAILAAMCCSAPPAWRQFVTKPAERERWGTVSEPKFRIRNPAADVKVNRFEHLLAADRDHLEKAEDEIKKISLLLSSREKHELLEKDPRLFAEIENKLTSLAEGLKHPQAAFLPPRHTANAPEHLQSCTQWAKVLFRKMTDQELPEGVTYKYRSSDKESRLGHTSRFSSVVNVSGNQTPELLLSTIMHEFGHHVCRISEENGSSSGNMALEEACAFSFEMAGAFISFDEYVKEAFFLEFDSQLNLWYDGQRDAPHPEGAAICDAATFLYGGPGTAFNALYTGSPDPVLMKIIEENQSRWDRQKELREDLSSRARELLKTMQEVKVRLPH